METNISNWREPDHSQWAFQNVDKLINVHQIRKGSNVSALESNLKVFDGFKINTPDGSALSIDDFLKATETDGFVLLQRGKIVYEKYDRTNSRESKHIMMSMSKSVTGLIAGMLASQGRLEVNALVTRYVPEVKDTPFAKVTVQQCLDMRSGVKYDDASPEYREAAGWNPVDSSRKPTDLHDFISAFHPATIAPIEGLDGAPFEYVSVNTDLMGWILERASGRKFGDVVSELLWQPMGAESDAYITLDRSGNARTAGGMCATTRDIARLGRLMLDDGDNVVPSAWIQDMLKNGSKEAFAKGSWGPRFAKYFSEPAYRSYWLSDRSDDVLLALGIHGQILIVDRANKIVMAKTSSQPDRTDAKKSALVFAAFKEFQRILA